jgi:hypothetical protein
VKRLLGASPWGKRMILSVGRSVLPLPICCFAPHPLSPIALFHDAWYN